MQIAAIQNDIVLEDKEANFERLSPWISSAAAAGARLVVLPEMFSCGFTMATDRVAEPPDGPTARFLAEQSRRHGLWIAGSLPERPADSEKPFNTLVVQGPSGEAFRYRKIHPFSFANEDRHYGRGDRYVTVKIDGVRCTLFVCYDLRFADSFWATAERTDCYVVVANWPERRRQHWKALIEARAIENLAYVVGVNRVGRAEGIPYAGDSRIVDPWGEVLASAAGVETLLLADVEPAKVEEVRASFPVLRDRRSID
jgi:predicted amidohydrolase